MNRSDGPCGNSDTTFEFYVIDLFGVFATTFFEFVSMFGNSFGNLFVNINVQDQGSLSLNAVFMMIVLDISMDGINGTPSIIIFVSGANFDATVWEF